MTWTVLELIWLRLPRVTVPRRMAFGGSKSTSSFKSVRALLHHVDEIINLGKENHGRGSTLVLGAHEAEGRSIIFKGFLPISYFLLLLNDLSDWYKHGLE
jgi:hypothetical protein